jgi:hypothetical protein
VITRRLGSRSLLYLLFTKAFMSVCPGGDERGAFRATTDTLNASLEQMKVVEEMRRTLREIKDVNQLEPN